jgi:hypothetical protein
MEENIKSFLSFLEIFDENEYLYHYTKSETALNHILKEKKLKFNSLEKLSDPRESIVFKNRANYWGKEIPENHWNSIIEAIKKEIPFWKVVCFCSDSFMLNGIPSNCIKVQLESSHRLYLKKNHLPFKSGGEKDRMWDQYANQYKGVCLVFRKKELIDNI